jgi:hypothetical protein
MSGLTTIRASAGVTTMENHKTDAHMAQHSHMSVISHDKERSYKGVFLLVCSTPFLILGSVSILSAGAASSSVESLKMAVIFFFFATIFIAMGIRILRYQYHLLLDKSQGHFSHQRDSLLSTSRIQGDIKQIKEISIRTGSTISFRGKGGEFSRNLFKIIARYNHQDLIVYISHDQDEALSMAATLSTFLGVPLNREEE